MSLLCLIVAGHASGLALAAPSPCRQAGMRTCLASDLEQALALMRMWAFSAIVVEPPAAADPKPALATLRAAASAPIVLLADLEEAGEIAALLAGATLVMPRSTSPALLAIKLRRLSELHLAAHESSGRELREPLQFGALALDPRRGTAAAGTQTLQLSPCEFDLLYLLASREGDYVSRDAIERMRGLTPSASRSTDMHVCRLRKKLQAAGYAEREVRTVYGRGYRLAPMTTALRQAAEAATSAPAAA